MQAAGFAALIFPVLALQTMALAALRPLTTHVDVLAVEERARAVSRSRFKFKLFLLGLAPQSCGAPELRRLCET